MGNGLATHCCREDAFLNAEEALMLPQDFPTAVSCLPARSECIPGRASSSAPTVTGRPTFSPEGDPEPDDSALPELQMPGMQATFVAGQAPAGPYCGVECHPMVRVPAESLFGASGLAGMSSPNSASPSRGQKLESLNYMPGGFDQGATADVERSHMRYDKIIVEHSPQVRTQRRSRAWEEWLRRAFVGQAVTLLDGFTEGTRSEQGKNALRKVPATYSVNGDLTKLTIVPSEGQQTPAITVPVDHIQVVCPAIDFVLFFEQAEAELDDDEKAQAVFIQYGAKGDIGQRRRVYLLETSATAKDHFVQALTALWLEKRNCHSMWF